MFELPQPITQINTQQDVAVARDDLRRLLSKPGYSDHGVSIFLQTLLRHSSPQWYGHILSLLDQVQTTINLDDILQYLIEHRVDEDVIFAYLPLIGRVNTHSMRSYQYLFHLFPDRKLEVLRAYEQQARMPDIHHEQIFAYVAEHIRADELSGFLQYSHQFFRQSLYPMRLIQALVKNPAIGITVLIEKNRDPLVYRSVLRHLPYLYRDVLASNPRGNLDLVFFALVTHDLFSTLDKQEYTDLSYEIVRRWGQDHLHTTLAQFLARIPSTYLFLFSEQLYRCAGEIHFDRGLAFSILRSIREQVSPYKRHEVRWIARVVAATDQSERHVFVHKDVPKLFNSHSSTAALYEVLIEENPFQFATYFLRKYRKFKKQFPDYYDEAPRKLFKQAWKKTPWWRRIVTLIGV